MSREIHWGHEGRKGPQTATRRECWDTESQVRFFPELRPRHEIMIWNPQDKKDFSWKDQLPTEGHEAWQEGDVGSRCRE